MKIKPNLIIVAGGLNTRFKEYSRIPKLLLPYLDNNSVLSHNLKNIEYSELYIIINHQYYDQLKNYLDINKIAAKVLPIYNVLGSYNAILEVSGLLPTSNLLFVWSDIIFKNKLNLEYSKNVTIYTKDGNYRYKASSSIIETVDPSIEKGNIPGIYYVPIFQTLECFNEKNTLKNYDLIDFIKDNDVNFEVSDITSEIIEFKDIEVYKSFSKVINEQSIPRFFNKISINKPYLIKESVDQKYNHLIELEAEWYNKASSLDIKTIPNIYNTTSTTINMEYLEGYLTLNSYLNKTKDFDIINNNIFPAIETLHSKETVKINKIQFIKDTKIEFYDKVINRVSSIQNMILDIDYNEFSKIVGKAYYLLQDLLNKQYIIDGPSYSFTHGDLNGSNIMVNPLTHDVKFIDPRGYYGESKLLGLVEYDYAKLYYFLHGYDNFNNGTYLFANDKQYDKPNILYTPRKLNKPIYNIMLGFIFINLSSYISNNIMKANISYHYGLELLKNSITFGE